MNRLAQSSFAKNQLLAFGPFWHWHNVGDFWQWHGITPFGTMRVLDRENWFLMSFGKMILLVSLAIFVNLLENF
jgi:hypothetical protein